ncbi:MAG: hypothetical protein K1V84_11160 [Muribaculaceae bacterium]
MKSFAFFLSCLLISLFGEVAAMVTSSGLVFDEPVSGTVFNVPNATIVERDSVSFRKAVFWTNSTYVYIYSMPNQEDKPFSWSKINEFDSNNKYGILTYQEKMSNADGWIRIYEYYDQKNKKKFYYAISLIRGDRYAIYVSECAHTPNDFVTLDMIKNTTFKITQNRRVNNDGSLTISFWGVVVMCVMIAGISKWFYGKDPCRSIVIAGLIVLSLTFVVLYYILLYSIGTSLLWTGILAMVWIAVIVSSSWTDFFNFLSKAFENIR